MTNTMRNTLHTAALRLLPTLALALALTACHDDDNDVAVVSYNGTATVRLHVSSDILGDLNATRADAETDYTNPDPYATEGEFMNTLCVFVVDENGTIEAKFGDGILDGYTEAQTGDLTEWTSEEVVLTSGSKTLYAFANWDNTESTEWAALIAKTVGDKIESTDLNFLVADPASKVDIANGSYIPMSGSAKVTVYDADLNSTQLLEVGMDRLVSKVVISVQGENATAVTISSFSFTGWADNVPMMSNDETPTYEFTYDKGYSNKEMDVKVEAGSSTTDLVWFYVNETYPTEGFTIEMEADVYDGTSYQAVTSATDIPRNHILPITLTLDTYTLQLTPTMWTSILGVDAELEYTSPITFADNTYYITLLDVTSTFSIAPSLWKGTTEVVGVDWTWKYVNEEVDEEASCTQGDDGTVTMTQLTATPGHEYPFTLTADWKNGDNATATSNQRTYNVKVIFSEGFPTVFKTSRSWHTIGMELITIKPKD